MQNLTNDQTGSFIYLVALLAFLGSGVLLGRRYKISLVLKQLFWWFLIILGVVFLYSFRYEFEDVKYRLKSALFPSSAIVRDGQIIISKSKDNHFYINLKVNDQNIRFLVDTGATITTLSQKDAKRIGIDVNNLTYNQIFNTANGRAFGASVRLDKIEINGILFYDIYASVNNSEMETSLLGMNFLENFKKKEFYQDKMILIKRY